MIRLLILCVIFVLFYIGIGAMEHYDSALKFTALGYHIETTLFAFTAAFVIIQLITMICLKLVYLMFNLPQIIRNEWQRSSIQKLNRKLLNTLAELLMGNKKKSLGLASKLISSLNDKNKNVIHLILAELSDNPGKREEYLRNLTTEKHYSIYALKRLAEISYKNMHYKQAEDYALKAFNEDDTDTELMLSLIRIYASLKTWQRLVFVVSKLQRADTKLLQKHSGEIAEYYYLAAKDYVQEESDDEALNYLESALELNPCHMPALNLFTKLAVNMKNSSSALKILKSAFAATPSFELAKMYANSAHSSSDVVYGTLANLATPAKYPELFLALATYLNLPDQIVKIKEASLSSYAPV
ncbi:MAG: hypothetical protein COA94_00080 [Rickettsiales bacterium]|nr:MAG: hypothetical protein COA94_00080 [Rickettsiales bacterium]